MGYELSNGDLFVTVGEETRKLGEGIPFTEEIELSGKEYLSHLYHLNATSNMSLTVDNVNLELLHNLCNMSPSNGKFTMEYQVPIMIQTRWHKNSRIRKKWLKRFGMKSDSVKVKVNATVGEYHTDDGSFDFEANEYEYIWRPDQKRKGLKIEWRTL